MIKKNKMKQQMVKRISALMLTATLCVSACPNVATGQEMTETEVVQQEGAESPSTDNSEDETKSATLKGLQILVNGTTITSNRVDLKKGDTLTVRAEIEGELVEIEGKDAARLSVFFVFGEVITSCPFKR